MNSIYNMHYLLNEMINKFTNDHMDEHWNHFTRNTRESQMWIAETEKDFPQCEPCNEMILDPKINNKIVLSKN